MNVGRKNAYRTVADGTKLSFTLLVCCNAAGKILPPFILYKAVALDIAWVDAGWGRRGWIWCVPKWVDV